MSGASGGVLLTGGAGFLGAAVAAELRRAGWLLHTTDLHGADEVLDVRDRDTLIAAVCRQRPRTLIHAAALTSGDPLELLAVNVGGTLGALEAAREAGCAHFILLSSAGVYAPKGVSVTEDSPTRTDHPYALSKLLAEQACRLGTGLRRWALRLGPVYGPGERPSASRERLSLIGELAQAARHREPVTLAHRPDAVHSWLHTADLARLLGLLMFRSATDRFGVYNVAGPPVRNGALPALFDSVQPGAGLARRVRWTPDAPLRHGAVDSSRLALDLPSFAPTLRLESGLQASVLTGSV